MAKKVVVAGIASILVVACVVAAAVTVTKKSSENSSSDSGSQVTTSSKSVEALCQPTRYKETCEKSLSSANNVTDPKDLIKLAFEATVTDIKNAIKNTSLFLEAASDPDTKDALRTCEEVFNLAVEDLKRSVEKVDNFDLTKIKVALDDLGTWLSAVVTYHGTCLDAFKKTKGDTGEKMKKLLNTTRELSSNGLVMVNSLGDLLVQTTGLGRKLLTTSASTTHHQDSFFTDAASGRRLLQVVNAKPNIVVAQDGSGQFKTINEALKTVPNMSPTPFIILIKAGTYQEYIDIPSTLTNLVFLGEGQAKTKITGNKSVKDVGVSTFHSATVAVNAAGFIAKDITIENTAGPDKEQAVAVRITGDKSAIYNCRIDGYQDTLYVHTNRQLYRDCTITGTIDFIFGDAEVVFQSCKIIVRKPLPNQSTAVTAQGREDPGSKGAVVLQNCDIRPEPGFQLSQNMKAYLGRPWKVYSRTIIMQSYIDGFIDPAGWEPWEATTQGQDTCWYAEFQNKGAGAALDKRINWKGYQKGVTEAALAPFTVTNLVNTDNWLSKANIPFEPGMMKV